ncbi:hypothetical protein EJ04DRAFT_571253 [Polyplosphaeria fusca]|uniref:Uncharacterized protein n=1 Tax=Polyplosphaeria fusca TaxID=682080 RepID=A0A9P4QJ28_9PLEO|nr:hypothetical protein EJ04DRAFT_571253 [Polyplosphaeria fusca]
MARVAPGSLPLDQVEAAAFLQRLTVYIGEPYFFLACRTCRVVVPISRIPAHFSNGHHGYGRADCVRLQTAWEAVYLPKLPHTMKSDGEIRDWRPPTATPAPIPELPVYHANRCLYKDAAGHRCTVLLDSGAAGGTSKAKGMARHCSKQHG